MIIDLQKETEAGSVSFVYRKGFRMKIGYNREETGSYGSTYGAVILAAGLSSRMKDFKPLLHVDGTTAIEGLVESAKVAGIDDITVVTGHNRELLSPVIAAMGVREAYNEDYEQGMFSSVKTGLAAAAASGKKGYLLMPVDCPLVSASVMREVMSAGLKEPEKFAVPVYEGKKGHPLLVSAGFIDEICTWQGGGGLKAVTNAHPDEMVRVPVNEEGCLLDMDTPEGYEEIVNFVKKGFRRDKLEVLSWKKRIILVRHGQTKQHDEPVFAGCYDVPLNDEGRAHAEASAKAVVDLIRADVAAEEAGIDPFGKEPMPAIERVYSSDLSRAAETAGEICRRIGAELPRSPQVKTMEDLREINLGEWDGRPVREIKEKYPEEYARRGEDMFTFKTAGGENFYDMQYRAVRGLREILGNDDARNIIIVAHSGVIRALENNLKGLRVDDEWEPLEKGGMRIIEPHG